MNHFPLFTFSETASPELIALLKSVTLGTHGAKYRHLNTEERIQQADNQLHLSIMRNEKLLGNVTFCRRDRAWYIRYVAFHPSMQGTGNKRSSGKSGMLKKEFENFFDSCLSSSSENAAQTDVFYAYIDPNNEKSLWISEFFGLRAVGSIATQTFSRISPKKQPRVERIDSWELVQEIIKSAFQKQQFYFDAQTKQGPFYVWRTPSGEIDAVCKITKARWEIERLPGKWGGFLTKFVRFVPSVRRLIRPKNHRFAVVDSVWVKNNDSKLLEQFFEGILHAEQERILFWWVDTRDPCYAAVQKPVKWGLLNRIIGVSRVEVVVRGGSRFKMDNSTPVFTSGFDFV